MSATTKLVDHTDHDTKWTNTYVQRCEFADGTISFCLFTTKDDEEWFSSYPTDGQILDCLKKWGHI